MIVLVINCGSSSVKYQVINTSSEESLLTGRIERIGEEIEGVILTHGKAIEQIFDGVWEMGIEAVGHRVVHGGDKFIDGVLIDEEVIKEITARCVDAPLHNPYNLQGIQIAQKLLPDAFHIAVFDTAFHARMPRRSQNYAFDTDLAQKYRIRRFGFHGTSHAYVAQKAAEVLERPLSELRVITLHLGNGASACAVEFGHSVETSMGMTPLEGLVMGTRSGDVDAGTILSLLRSGDFDIDGIDNLLNKESGLLGLSSVSNDMREIEHQAEQGNDRARLAINVFCHRVRKYIGAYAAIMGGLDAVVFTGGIGENSITMRRRIAQRLEFLGLMLDEDRNRDVLLKSDSDSAVITTDRSRVEAIVVKTNEELMIARKAHKVVSERDTSIVQKNIPIAVSARHLHLNEATFAKLFGEGIKPTRYKDISQPGQYACNEKVNLIGPRNRIEGVRLLGPLRSQNQIEISRSDEFKLGVDAPIRDSGKVKESAPIILQGPNGTVNLTEGLICARRHIHMHPDDAQYFGVMDKDVVEVEISGGPRDLTFGDVLIRVAKGYKLEMHIDTDEANAAELNRGASGELVYDHIDDASANLTVIR